MQRLIRTWGVPAGLAVAIAFVDWLTPLPLGGFQIVPVVMAARHLGPVGIAAASLAAGLARELAGPFAEFMPLRWLLSSAMFLAAGLYVHSLANCLRGLQALVAAGNDSRRALPRREREVLDLVMAGKANKEIAGQLGLSESAVKDTIRRLFGRFGVGTRTQLVSAALAGAPRASAASL